MAVLLVMAVTTIKSTYSLDVETVRTLESLSEEFDVSRERIRQIEVRAFQKVQASMRDAVARSETVPMALKALPPSDQVVDAL